MKTLLALALFISVGACGQTAKPECVNNEIDHALSDEHYIIQCRDGQWTTVATAFQKRIDAENAHNRQLVEDMETKVVSEDELAEVMKIGYNVLLEIDGRGGYREEEVRREFEDLLAAQFRLRQIAKEESMDVPAIQEPSDHFVQWCDPEPSKWCHQEPDGPPKWSCKDKSRTLMETLDGKTHYCHKPSFGP